MILDEAQDTHGEQLKLLELLFGRAGTAFQRLGDCNQRLYEDDADVPAYWAPGPGCIPLDTSRRFGGEIAAFASGLTTRKAQTIVGAGKRPAALVLFLFDEATIGNVLSAFADEARAHWGEGCSMRDIWAVASRHNVPGKKTGAWEPKSLVDYHRAYRGDGSARKSAQLFYHQLQRTAVHHAAARSPAEVAAMLAAAVAGFARVNSWKSPTGKPVTGHNVWSTLAQRDHDLPRAVRRLLYEDVLRGDAPWDENAWKAFVGKLRPLFNASPDSAAAKSIAEYCEFVIGPPLSLDDSERGSAKEVEFGDVRLRLGSIHSVKGKSVDGILVLESQIWKGSGKGQHCIDLSTVLPRAFGITSQAFADVELTAATNVFVAITRAREMLGLAMRKSEAASLIDAAEAQGWKLVDLVARANAGACS